MTLYRCLVILVAVCLQWTFQLNCVWDESNSDDPCDCESTLIMFLNDSTEPGTTIANFSSNSSLVSMECPGFNYTDGQFILLVDLRKPCSSEEIKCKRKCGEYGYDTSILINHVDEYPPRFPNDTYITTLSEDKEVNTEVFDFLKDENKPIDEDCPKNKSYLFSIEKDSGEGGVFILTSTNGKVTLKKNVDYEATKTYNFTVGVITYGNSEKIGYTNLIVNILDADDNNPEFVQRKFNLNVTEETLTSSLQTLPPVRGYDGDKGINQTIWYSFEDYENISSFLQINMEDGTFTVIETVDRENTSFDNDIIIWCFQSDKHEKMALAVLSVNIVDINDNPAIFTPGVYNVTLLEHAIGYVTTVTATDKDIGNNAVIIYELLNGTQVFGIDNRTGVVSVKTPADLDREETPTLQILVIAKDLDGNISANTATVMVTLQDINDNGPVFDKEAYAFNINTTKPGARFGQINATDADEPGTPNANVTYYLYQTSSAVPFNIDKQDGWLSILSWFDSDKEYEFLVQACDNPTDDNDRELYVEVHENVPNGTLLGQILPVDGNRYDVSIDEFGVDPQSFMLKTNTELDREMNETYNFYIKVYRHNELRGNISVNVTILDVNDNTPVFSRDEYFFTILDIVDKKTPTVMATDNDADENANLTYSFKQTSSDLFTIEESTGNISTSELWVDGSTTKQTLYYLIVVATDQGDPPRKAVVPVYVSTMSVNASSEVGITSSLSSIDDIQEKLEREFAALLGFDSVTVEHFNESSTGIYIKAYMNNTEVDVIEVQRSLVQNWSSVQDMFRKYMIQTIAAVHDHSDLTMSTAEIAMITISVVVFFGGLICIIIICKQWDTHLKNHRLYDSLRRPSTLYDSQELRVDFGDEPLPSRFSTFRGARRKENEVLEGSFGLGGYVNASYNSDGDAVNAPTTPTWSCADTPRVPRWSTSDSLKDAIESLDELTNRLNSEDNISRITNMSKAISNKSEPVTPRSEAYEQLTPAAMSTPRQYEDLQIPSANDDQAEKPPSETDRSEDQLIMSSPETKRLNYENLNLEPRLDNLIQGTHVHELGKVVDNEEGYDSGISEAEKIQEIIETNQDSLDNDDTIDMIEDIVLEETTAF